MPGAQETPAATYHLSSEKEGEVSPALKARIATEQQVVAQAFQQAEVQGADLPKLTQFWMKRVEREALNRKPVFYRVADEQGAPLAEIGGLKSGEQSELLDVLCAGQQTPPVHLHNQRYFLKDQATFDVLSHDAANVVGSALKEAGCSAASASASNSGLPGAAPAGKSR